MVYKDESRRAKVTASHRVGFLRSLTALPTVMIPCSWSGPGPVNLRYANNLTERTLRTPSASYSSALLQVTSFATFIQNAQLHSTTVHSVSACVIHNAKHEALHFPSLLKFIRMEQLPKSPSLNIPPAFGGRAWQIRIRMLIG